MLPLVATAAEIQLVTFPEFLHAAESGSVTEVRFVDVASIEWTQPDRPGVIFIAYNPVRPGENPLLIAHLEKYHVKVGSPIESKLPPPKSQLGYWFGNFALLWVIIIMQLAMFIYLLVWLPRLRQKHPNKPVEVTPTAVTPAANAPGAPSAGVPHQ